jgi:DNA-binding response OmpR family regulator
MKLLVVLGSDEIFDIIAQNIKPLGFDLIWYRHVLKAMDNIDEVDPTGIIISARDFPRHWKIMVQFTRSERSKENCPIIILKGRDFSLEEASKAFYLGVSGIVSEDLENAAEVDRLQKILGRYVAIEDKRKTHRFHAEAWNRMGICISNPQDKTMINGVVKTISSSGISFVPEDSAVVDNLIEGQELSECSLRTGDTILSPICRVVRMGPEISLEFLFLPNDEQNQLDTYLEGLPLEEVKAKQAQA